MHRRVLKLCIYIILGSGRERLINFEMVNEHIEKYTNYQSTGILTNSIIKDAIAIYKPNFEPLNLSNKTALTMITFSPRDLTFVS